MKKVFAPIVLTFCLSFAYGSGADGIVPDIYMESLRTEGVVSVIHEEDDNELSLVPQSRYRDIILENRIEKKDSPYTAEFLYLIPKKDISSAEMDEGCITIERISEIFTAISKMSGMRYRCTERNSKGYVLYKRVFTLESLSGQKKVADKVTGNCDGLSVFCHQHDRLLGNIKFLLEYKMEGNEIYLSILNKSDLGLFGIDACKADDLRINIHVIDCGEEVLFYISADANYDNVLKMFSIRKFIQKLMLERLDAIYNWFFLQFRQGKIGSGA